MRIKFWGIRGSVPSPLMPTETSGKIQTLLKEFQDFDKKDWQEFLNNQPFWKKSTYGGNTSCVEVAVGNERVILDMGTGIRRLGNELFKEMMEKRGLRVTFLVSHVHWDHIQGLPFFGPLYMNKELGIENGWAFYGGVDWMKNVELCLRGQMDPPTFPVSWTEIKKITYFIQTYDVYDHMTFWVGSSLKVKARKLNHPQETYGWRLEGEGKVLVYTTDNEPYDPRYPDPRLLDLVKGADLWITDCQYTRDIYNGLIGGTSRHGWGHSYPEAVAETAVKGDVKEVVLFHHDPSSSDKAIYEMEQTTQKLISDLGGKAKVIAAHEELEIILF